MQTSRFKGRRHIAWASATNTCVALPDWLGVKILPSFLDKGIHHFDSSFRHFTLRTRTADAMQHKEQELARTKMVKIDGKYGTTRVFPFLSAITSFAQAIGMIGISRKQAEKERSEKHAKKMEEDEFLTAMKCFSIQVRKHSFFAILFARHSSIFIIFDISTNVTQNETEK